MDTVVYVGLPILVSVFIAVATFFVWRATEKMATIEFLRYAELVSKDLLADTMIKSLGRKDERLTQTILISARAHFFKQQFPRMFKKFSIIITQVMEGMKPEGNN